MSDKESVQKFYDSAAKGYEKQYEHAAIHDTTRKYPGNFFRLQHLLTSFANAGIKRVIEVGVGEGTPLSFLAGTGVDVYGFDISKAMVEKSKKRMTELGLDPDHIFLGDILDSTTFMHSMRGGAFDGLMAMGVMPHVHNDDLAVKNMASLVRPSGKVFIEFRNKIFSLFTMNRLTREFIVDDLLAGVSDELREMVGEELAAKLRMDMPPVRNLSEDGTAPGYDAIPSKFHNPFEIPSLFERHGFRDIRLIWYHYHPAMPYLEAQAPEAFRRDAVRLEHEASGWRGYFLCSAFVVEATKEGYDE